MVAPAEFRPSVTAPSPRHKQRQCVMDGGAAAVMASPVISPVVLRYALPPFRPPTALRQKHAQNRRSAVSHRHAGTLVGRAGTASTRVCSALRYRSRRDLPRLSNGCCRPILKRQNQRWREVFIVSISRYGCWPPRGRGFHAMSSQHGTTVVPSVRHACRLRQFRYC